MDSKWNLNGRKNQNLLDRSRYGESLWSDPWCGNTNLQSRFPLIYDLSKDKHMCIEKTFDKSYGRGWNIVLNRILNDWEVVEFENLMPLLETT